MDYKQLNRELAERIAYYATTIRSTFYALSDELVMLAMKVADGYDAEVPFRFDDYPQISKKAEEIFNQLRQEVYDTIVNAQGIERKMADVDTGLIATAVLSAQVARSNPEYKPLFASKPVISQESLHKFTNTVKPPTPSGSGASGMHPRRFDLSGRVWNLAGSARTEIESVISEGLREGMSADNISRRVRQYLNEPDRLFRRVRDENGDLVLSKAARDFHPGQGVYRSSYKNAVRLARTEINIAYHEQAHERWQKLDFIVGFRVVLSGAHPVTDICDDLQGEYPKEFKFTGWHPQCMCHVIALIKGEDKEVGDVPENFKKWVIDNEDRIEKAHNIGTLPYFLQDNAKFAGVKVNPKNFMERAEIHRIEANRAEYERLKKDDSYVDVRFNKNTGGMLAIHKDHHFDPTIGRFGIPRGDYERITVETLYRYGRSAVLGSEKMPDGVRPPEGLLDGKKFEIKGIESVGKYNVINDLKLASKKKAESIIFYYHDKNIFSERHLIDSYNFYMRNSQSKCIQKVYYIIENKLYTL
jgi:hypothetical protein